jgi:hypothetical protein
MLGSVALQQPVVAYGFMPVDHPFVRAAACAASIAARGGFL